MRFVKAVFMIVLWVPCFARADGGDVNVKDIRVPFSRIYESVRGFEPLYNSSFVYLLESRIGNNGIHLGEIAQACMDYTLRNRHVTRDMCVNFVSRIIGETIDYDANFGEIVITTTSDVSDTFSFEINASGRFKFKCSDSDGWVPIELTDVEKRNVSCTYGGAATERRIVFRGLATGYSNDEDTPVINFRDNRNLIKVSGSLGKIFPTLQNDVSPRFVGTFWECENLTDISGLSFENITVGAKNMFWGTFGKTGIKSIPAGLFSGLTNASAERMFAMTFYGCSELTSIPEDLFMNVGVQESLPDEMFLGTFANCSNVKSMGPMIDKKHLYQIFDWGKDKTACFCGAENMSGHGEIPYTWK